MNYLIYHLKLRQDAACHTQAAERNESGADRSEREAAHLPRDEDVVREAQSPPVTRRESSDR